MEHWKKYEENRDAAMKVIMEPLPKMKTREKRGRFNRKDFVLGIGLWASVFAGIASIFVGFKRNVQRPKE